MMSDPPWPVFKQESYEVGLARTPPTTPLRLLLGHFPSTIPLGYKVPLANTVFGAEP